MTPLRLGTSLAKRLWAPEEWDEEIASLRLQLTLYPEEWDAIAEECEDYPGTWGDRLYEEKAQRLAAQVTGFDEAEKRFPPRPWYEERRPWGNPHEERARAYGCDTGLTRDQWTLVVEAFGHSCAYCFARTRHLTVDHVVPMSRRGANRIENVVPACPSCNSSKGAKSLAVWLERRTDLDATAIFARMESARRSVRLDEDAMRRAA